MFVDLALYRDKLAEAVDGYETTPRPLAGYREPPGTLMLPAFVVLDPDIDYLDTWDGDVQVTIPARVIVPIGLAQPGRQLDELLNPAALPATIREFDAGGAWSQAVVLRKRPGPYLEYAPGPKRETVGLTADIDIKITPSATPPEEPEP